MTGCMRFLMSSIIPLIPTLYYGWIYRLLGFMRNIKRSLVRKSKELAMNLLQRFYQEIRNFSVNAVILAATPQRLYLAIPLSVNGQKYLEKMVNTSVSLPEDTEKSRTAERLGEPILEEVPPMAEPKEKDQG